MSKETKKTKKKVTEGQPSTTDRLNSFIPFVVRNLQMLDSNDTVFENRIDYILSKLAGDNVVDEDQIGDDANFVSSFYVETNGKLCKIKFLIEGYQLVPKETVVGDDGVDVPSDPNKFTFKKEDIEVEIVAPSLEEAVEELKTRIRASRNIEIVKA